MSFDNFFRRPTAHYDALRGGLGTAQDYDSFRVVALAESPVDDGNGWRPEAERFDDYEPEFDTWRYVAEDRPLGAVWRPVAEWDDPTWLLAEFNEDEFVGLLDKSAPVSKGTTDAWVYYAIRQGLVKIGCSRSPEDRVRYFGAGLLAVEGGGFPREMERHWQFAHAHVVGEWFELVPDLRDHIRSLAREDIEGIAS